MRAAVRMAGVDVLARLDALEAAVSALTARLAGHEASRPDRDRADADLRFALAVAHADRASILASDVIGTDDPALKRALRACDITTAGELGAWLRDRKGVRDGITIKKDRRRGRWRVTSATYVPPGPDGGA
jgi:hypothetical protein